LIYQNCNLGSLHKIGKTHKSLNR